MPSVSQRYRGSIADKFLQSKLQSPERVLVSSNPLWAARLAGTAFENWQGWLELLSGRLAALARSLENGDASTSTTSSGGGDTSAMDGMSTSVHHPAQVIATELEQVISALYIASATGSGGGGDGGLAPESVAMPPSGLTARLLMDTGLSYGGTLSLYCALLSEAATPSASGSGSGSAGAVLLEVVQGQGQGLSVDPLESAIANDAYRLQLLESGISTLVQWLQVATKHSVARSRDGGSSDSALAELVRYNSTASSKSTLRTRSARLALASGAHDEEKEEHSEGRLAGIFSALSGALDAMASPLPRAPPALAALGADYDKARRASLAKLTGELRSASLLQQRFVSEM